ncbi:MAG: MCP four helix bundle domain-containing protein [Syntrophobacterales bacterium]|jgi:two-component system sensor histidine kinase GlrK|nr:MCP four helix bundle domain-containing protein [Syntrophobacterales bacterium]
MKFTISNRLILSYLVIFFINGAVSVYAVLKLSQVSKETSTLFNIDERLLDIRKKLADSFLSQLTYQKKYIIAMDPIFHDEFIFAGNDFNKYLAKAKSIADTPAKKSLLSQIETSYAQYLALINEEIDKSTAKRPSSKQEYDRKKQEMVREILERLRAVEAQSQEDIFTRTGKVREAAADALHLVIIMLIVAIVLIIGISFRITTSITKPLMALMEKTKDISKGIFEDNLNVTSPPEISQLAIALNDMCHKLKQVDTMKSEFFSAMSHELRTPLTAIKQGIGLLQDGVGGTISNNQQRIMKTLSEEVHRLIDMVNSLLDLSKMEAGMMTYNFRSEDLPLLVEKVIIEMALIVEAKNITVKMAPGKNIPPLKLDRERILQALRNLIGNAAKFTPDGGQINLSCTYRDREVEFCVADTGPGIPKENLNAIFEKFHQLPVKASEWAKGTGLGLAFVKHIITAHGGKIWAESKLGQGSTFIFVLPS